ncbi:MAG TPA: hypothetical protein VHF90_10500 [Thermoleophilaceae bacterium]|nr:hypothetical protein [Thermoleophilaceae bacterium]
MTTLTVEVYADGSEPHDAWGVIRDAWATEWSSTYPSIGAVAFEEARDLKAADVRAALPPRLSFISDIRNPDLFFTIREHRLELAGLEFSTHSPDGSNIEKRYPLLWSARRYGVHGFLLTPYSKRRGNGTSINRVPRRAAQRNLDVLGAWSPDDPEGGLALTLPSLELQEGDIEAVPDSVQPHLVSWEDVGRLLAHLMAARLAASGGPWSGPLTQARDDLRTMSEACRDATNASTASSLHYDGSRWIQVYNARPETGHWERGEGQFDSIDGRLMVTLDAIDLLPAPSARPRLEFWLPQLVSSHAWVLEQRAAGYGSKRFGNIMRVLRALCLTKFADHLTPRDWAILSANPRLLLEREDRWPSDIYRIVDVTPDDRRAEIARHGLPSLGSAVAREVEALLGNEHLYYTSHRAYEAGWQERLSAGLARVPSGSTVIAPRLPAVLLEQLGRAGVDLVPGDRCTRSQLVMLRQIERSPHRTIAPFSGR